MLPDTILQQLADLKDCPVLDPSIYPKPDPTAVAIYNQAVDQRDKITEKERAVQYQKAAEKGYWPAMYNLGVLYYQGEGVPESPEKALYWWRELAKLNIPEGYEALAGAYEQGIGVPADRGKANEYRFKAVMTGSPESQYWFGQYLYNHYGQEQRPLYIKITECAAKQGYKEAYYDLAIHYKTIENHKLAYQWLRRGAKAGGSGCVRNLANAYIGMANWDGIHLMRDEKRAACLYKLDSDLDKNPDLTFPDLDERCPPNVAQPNVNDDPFPPPRKR